MLAEKSGNKYNNKGIKWSVNEEENANNKKSVTLKLWERFQQRAMTKYDT